MRLYRTYPNEGVQIRKVGTNEIYDEAIDVYGLWWHESFGKYMNYAETAWDGETETVTSIKGSSIFFWIGDNKNNKISVSISGEGSLVAFETYAIMHMTGDGTITISRIW